MNKDLLLYEKSRAGRRTLRLGELDVPAADVKRLPKGSLREKFAVLPEVGVTYYDVPQDYAVTPYRYTVVNDRTVLVNPRTRRVMQIVE